MKIKANVVDLFLREIYPGEVLIRGCCIEEVKRIDEEVKGYIMPGFVDSHVHIESSMVVPSEFARQAVGHGTVAVITDPHEIANVIGVEGVEFMLDNASRVPLKFYFGAPSCVPATPLESSGAKLGPEEVGKLLLRDDIHFLSEMMNYPGVLNDDPDVMEKLRLAREAGKRVDGHAPGLGGADLEKYLAAGISTDHEASSYEEAVEKIRGGMKIQIREGSAARNLEVLAPLLKDYPGDVMLCSDDIHPEMLMKRHINGPVKELLDKGYDLFDVLRAASANAVEHYGLDVGLLREGQQADFIIVDNLEDFNVLETWIAGSRVFNRSDLSFGPVDVKALNNFNSSPVVITQIAVKNQAGLVKVIDVREGELLTGIYRTRWSEEPELAAEPSQDILKLVVKERYNDMDPAVAFIRGIGIKRGAIAGTVAHDSHNIIAVGVDDNSICRAINSLVESKGGLVLCDGEETHLLPLPVAGIMSDVPCGTVAGKYLELSEKVRDMGSHLKAPFMTLSFMSLLVIPELKLGDRGLFDGINFRFTSLFAEE